MTTMTTRRWGTGSVCVGAVATLLGGVALAQEQRPAPPAATPTPASATQEDPGAAADRLLAKAQSPAEAAIAWLAEHPTSSGEPAEARFARAIEQSAAGAAAHPAPGVRFFDVAGGQGRWVEDSGSLELPARVVLMVGGLDAPGAVFDTAAPALVSALGERAARVRVGRMDWPADRSLRSAGDLLARALRDLAKRGVRSVDLVGHSTGGLIVRDVLTRPEFYNGFPAPAEGGKGQGLPRLGRVIFVGTPGRGTWLAPVLAAREVRTNFAKWIDTDGADHAAFAAFFGGMPAESLRDVAPGSAYLTELNARPTPKWTKGSNASPAPDEVPVTVVVGTLAGGSVLEGVELKPMLSWPIVRQTLKEGDAERALAALEEFGKVVSDGVVPVASGELEGADDVVYAEANHRSLLRPWVQGETEQPPAVKVIVDRLK